MHEPLLELLRCPVSGQTLAIEQPKREGERVVSGTLASPDGKNRYPIRDSIPRFVPASNYADSFGMQWNKFRQTQLDSTTGLPISANRFYSQSGWRPEDLQGKLVLDVGCGAGRFAEIAATARARVVAVDYSGAVDACLKNLGAHPNVDVLQGDVYRLPFCPASFDFVYCFGVIQHTPDVKAAFMALTKQVKPGGSIAVDVYRRHWSNWAHPKYLLRPLTKRMSQARLFKFVEQCAPALLSLSSQMSNIPLLGQYLRRLVPVANYSGILPLGRQQLTEWAILDTYDWLAPRYDQPQYGSTLAEWAREAGLVDIELVHPAHLTLRARRPKVL